MNEVSNTDIASAVLVKLHVTGSYAAASYMAMSILASQNGGSGKMVSNHYPELIWAKILEALKSLSATTMPYKDGGVIFNLHNRSRVSNQTKQDIEYLLLF